MSAVHLPAIVGLTTTTIGVIGLFIICVGWVVYAIFNVVGGKREVGSEVELAPNRREYFDDETLEGPRLMRVQLLGVILLAIIVVALPLYWVFEPSRQAGAEEGWDKRFASWGSQLFAPTAEGGFNCAGCHGGMQAVGGEAPFTVTDPVTQEVQAVNWKAPALNTAFYKFDEEEIRFILNYGRPFSPMSPWGLVGGGPMNTQQIDTLIAYIESIQIPRENCGEGEDDTLTCESGNLPAEMQEEVQAAAELAVENGEAGSIGEALFNLELSSGAYSCARCHTLGWSYGEPGVPGQGAYGWNLTGGSVNAHFLNEDQLISFIEDGSEYGKLYGRNGQGSGRMPGFGSLLTDEQIQEIVDYVRSL
jgi:mono/diheme cytochrome c family protein